MKKGLIVTAGAILVLIGTYFLMKVHYQNEEIRLRNLTEAQQKVCKANFDKMFKVIAQDAQIAQKNMDEARKSFKQIYIPLMQGRYSNARGGALMSWIREHNPNFDLKATSELYKKLQEAIESNRAEFFMEQKKLISYRNQHLNLIKTFPGSWFLSKQPIKIIVITSTKTENTYQTGKEDDINLFK